VKGSVIEALEPLLRQAGIDFVGSHPMAGSEKTGIEAATNDLFEGATCLVTPTANTNADALARVESFWQTLGAKTLRMSLDVHDRKVARISHAPHAVAYAQVMAALKVDPSAAQIVGNGFRDSTRIAASDPDLWTGILLENKSEVVSALADTAARIQDVLAMVRDGDKEKLRQFLAEAQQLRAQVPTDASDHGNP
jgi:prephenate dehydrogenase